MYRRAGGRRIDAVSWPSAVQLLIVSILHCKLDGSSILYCELDGASILYGDSIIFNNGAMSPELELGCLNDKFGR